MTETRTVRIRITGRVQGVGYRDWLRRRAEHFGLAGWVRNREDGSVEALLSGSTEIVADMLNDCRQGPPAAMVRDVAIEEEEAPGGPEFKVLPTA